MGRLFGYSLALLATPALADDNGHSGVAGVRTGPELSDLALFAMAVLAVWFVRRRLRQRLGRRFRKD